MSDSEEYTVNLLTRSQAKRFWEYGRKSSGEDEDNDSGKEDHGKIPSPNILHFDSNKDSSSFIF